MILFSSLAIKFTQTSSISKDCSQKDFNFVLLVNDSSFSVNEIRNMLNDFELEFGSRIGIFEFNGPISSYHYFKNIDVFPSIAVFKKKTFRRILPCPLAYSALRYYCNWILDPHYQIINNSFEFFQFCHLLPQNLIITDPSLFKYAKEISNEFSGDLIVGILNNSEITSQLNLPPIQLNRPHDLNNTNISTFQMDILKKHVNYQGLVEARHYYYRPSGPVLSAFFELDNTFQRDEVIRLLSSVKSVLPSDTPSLIFDNLNGFYKNVYHIPNYVRWPFFVYINNQSTYEVFDYDSFSLSNFVNWVNQTSIKFRTGQQNDIDFSDYLNLTHIKIISYYDYLLLQPDQKSSNVIFFGTLDSYQVHHINWLGNVFNSLSLPINLYVISPKATILKFIDFNYFVVHPIGTQLIPHIVYSEKHWNNIAMNIFNLTGLNRSQINVIQEKIHQLYKQDQYFISLRQMYHKNPYELTKILKEEKEKIIKPLEDSVSSDHDWIQDLL